ncbi:FMN-binding glutamate synthase family protein [Bacillus sp. DJP31]|uniref:FMN-binding glutamate synthase family protein n=1 Tax=Bacillus sp. DJP31 TaxID=3409789 RepID=UPI003BB78922
MNPRQLFELPTKSKKDVQTKTVIGPNTKKPLELDTPIMLTGMSYGGSLSLKMRMAIAKGTSLAGTSTNTGETGLTNEERDNAKILIGQYNRAMRMKEEDLKHLDAIEVQLGQGAWGGAAEIKTKAQDIGDHLRETWDLKEGEDSTIQPRFPNVESSQDIINLINRLKSDYGGTAGAPPTFEDDIGLPTLHALVRAVDWLKEHNLKDKVQIIAAGGLTTPGHFIKALAIGADAVYIGSIALMATLQSQMTKALPNMPPPQLALYSGKLQDEFDPEEGAKDLANFLKSCTEEIKGALQVMGKKQLNELSREDLVTMDKDLAEFMGIRYGASHRKTK